MSCLSVSPGKLYFCDWQSVLPAHAADPPADGGASAVDDSECGGALLARWDVPVECRWDKPPGFPRCSSCLRNLAAHRIQGDKRRLCFTCFRAEHAPVEFITRCGYEPLVWEVRDAPCVASGSSLGNGCE